MNTPTYTHVSLFEVSPQFDHAAEPHSRHPRECRVCGHAITLDTIPTSPNVGDYATKIASEIFGPLDADVDTSDAAILSMLAQAARRGYELAMGVNA